MTLADAIDRFLVEWPVERNLAPASVSQYRYILPLFLCRLVDLPLPAITRALLLDALARHRRTHSTATTYAALAVVKTFFKWTKREGFITANPTEWMLTNPPRPVLPRVITYRQVLDMMESLGRISPFDLRDRAMIGVSFAALLRVDQAVNARLSDYDDSLSTPGLFLASHKRGESRLARIAGPPREAMTEYLYEARADLVGDHLDRGWLFVAGSGLRVKRETWSKTLKQIGWNVGIRLPVTPHVLRHAAATHHARKGVKPYELAAMLGHRDLRAAMAYVHVASADLDDIAERNLSEPTELRV